MHTVVVALLAATVTNRAAVGVVVEVLLLGPRSPRFLLPIGTVCSEVPLISLMMIMGARHNL